MPDPISALSSFGAFKRINFETIYANGGSFIGTVGMVGSLTGHTTISACTAVLKYLDVSTKWTQSAQMWVNSHQPLVIVAGITLMTVSISLLGTNINVFRCGSTTAWGIALLLSTQTPIGSKGMFVIVSLPVIVFMFLLTLKYRGGAMASYFLTSLFYCLLSLWLSLSGSRSLRRDDTGSLGQ